MNSDSATYLAGDAWSDGKTAWKSVGSKVTLNGLLQFIHRAVVRAVLVSLFPPSRRVESYATMTTRRIYGMRNIV